MAVCDLPYEFNTVLDEFGEYEIRLVNRHSLGCHFVVAVGKKQVIEMVTCFKPHVKRYRDRFEFTMNCEQTKFSVPFELEEASN